MTGGALEVGDIVFIVSAIDNKAKPELGVGLVVALSSSIPAGLGCNEIKETCTLIWNGEVERDIAVEWVEVICCDASGS